MTRHINIATFLLVLALCASSGTLLAQTEPSILVFADKDTYFPGESIMLRGVVLAGGLPPAVEYTLVVERMEGITLLGNPDDIRNSQGVLSAIPVQQPVEWKEVETHNVRFWPGQPVRTSPNSVNNLAPFVRIPISETNQAWESGQYRIRVRSNLEHTGAQTVYFVVDPVTNLAARPVPSVSIVDRNIVGIQTKFSWQVPNWTAILSDSSGHVSIQSLAFYGESMQVFLNWNTGIFTGGSVRVALYDPNSGITATYLLR